MVHLFSALPAIAPIVIVATVSVSFFRKRLSDTTNIATSPASFNLQTSTILRQQPKTTTSKLHHLDKKWLLHMKNRNFSA